MNHADLGLIRVLEHSAAILVPTAGRGVEQRPVLRYAGKCLDQARQFREGTLEMIRGEGSPLGI